MKKSKSVLAIILAAALSVTSICPALAAEESGETGATVGGDVVEEIGGEGSSEGEEAETEESEGTAETSREEAMPADISEEETSEHDEKEITEDVQPSEADNISSEEEIASDDVQKEIDTPDSDISEDTEEKQDKKDADQEDKTEISEAEKGNLENEQETAEEGQETEPETDPVSDFTGTITVQADEQKVSPGEVDGISADDLFAAYVDDAFGLSDKTARKKAKKNAGLNLTGINEAIYSYIAERLPEIASGEQASTTFEISADSLKMGKTAWTAEELGVDAIIIGNDNGEVSIAEDALSAVKEKCAYDLTLIVDSLLADFPYQLYWYEKTKDTSGTYFDVTSFSDDTTGEQMLGISGAIIISFPVANEYASDEYSVNTSIGQSVQTSVENAQAIVSEYADRTDLEKLNGYRERICDLVSYYDEAASGSISYGNPWQIIWVFDGDNSTNVVCEGYAKAFKYLCDLSSFTEDINCITVSGMMSGGVGEGSHMWDLVSMEDENNYLVDITNCDSGAVGAPDLLFLAGTSDKIMNGEQETGYILHIKNADITYQYDEETLSIYSPSALQLHITNKNFP